MKDSSYKDCKYPVLDAEFVTMTKKEYCKLVERFGETNTSLAIEKLDNYKGSLGRKYKSDYRAILSWVIDAIKSNGSSYPSYYDNKFEKTLNGDQIIAYHKHLISLGWVKNYSGTAGTTWKR